MGPDVHGHLLPVLQRNVGRIGDHQIDRPVQSGEGVGHVAFGQLDAGSGEIALRDAGSFGRQFDRVLPAPGAFGCDGGRDGAASGAQFDDDRLAAQLLELRDGPTGHHLGLGSGDEDARRDGHTHGAEPGLPGEVLHRLSGEPALHELRELGRCGVVDRRQGGQERGFDPGRMSQQCSRLGHRVEA